MLHAVVGVARTPLGARRSGSTRHLRPRCSVRVSASAEGVLTQLRRDAHQKGGNRQSWAPSRELLDEAADAELSHLLQAADDVCRAGHGDLVTFSPKVFIPLTRLCRDSCGYCTFAAPPRPGQRGYMTLDEVLAVARAGTEAGCTEALFTLGDKPELEYPEAAAELRALGHETTLSYAIEAAAAVLNETGLLPHMNAGMLTATEYARARQVSVSQGLMLESTSARLAAPGGAHHNCPDKEPSARLASIAAAGEAAVPFTSGILIGIGETRAERIDALLALREAHARHGHIQEIIVQNFRAKGGTAMADHPEPPLEELLWTCAMARLVFGPEMSIQAPPNLQRGEEAAWTALLGAGINDWGGISPVTRDHVNPEAPWPLIGALSAATAAAGKHLAPRLPIYPRFAFHLDKWVDTQGGPASVAAATLRHLDGSGLARGCPWTAGAGDEQGGDTSASTSIAAAADAATRRSSGAGAGPSDAGAEKVSTGGFFSAKYNALKRAGSQAATALRVGASGVVAPEQSPSEAAPSRAARPGSGSGSGSGLPPLVAGVLERAAAGGLAEQPLTEAEVVALFEARSDTFDAVCKAADALRRSACGDSVSYVVNRNINYTNVCAYACAFCAFSKGASDRAISGAPYVVPLEEVQRRAAEAWARGATEVCLQGGIHPEFTGHTYLSIVEAVKAAVPAMHVHAFSPLEVTHGAQTLGLSVEAFLRELKAAGLGSLPGTAAEVLDDKVRDILCPDKLRTAEWLAVIEAAHSVGLRTTSTIMFGSVERGYGPWARHLLAIRDLQRRTGGITEFVPLPFVHMEAPLYRKGLSRRGPTLREAVLMHAAARLALHPWVPNIQASWVKMGPSRAASLLAAGANDMGGVLMNESITRAAGAEYGQELGPREMERLIVAAGRLPRQRTTLYGAADAAQTARSLEAAAAGAGVAPTQQREAAAARDGGVLLTPARRVLQEAAAAAAAAGGGGAASSAASGGSR